MIVRVATDADMGACFALRRTVFIDEQNVPEELELDEHDQTAVHLIAEIDGTPMGTARMMFGDDYAKVGRVCVLQSARGTGLGKALMLETIKQAKLRPGITKVILQAQISALGFYEALGFVAHGGIVMDAGIEHRDMVLALT
ncbi:GNAT family N-acetyltransferase [uncultured Pelagimonas sp.]|uniref:GNAT family N-acetyltransferase n=1 Tax=uncultured Pelagimonas sp. TaxID=1618102 RepID=UPI00261BF662|nr:GNAT family N-acetyltransferase [uncultured Pelagimonas sp.]